jgi:atypical dual specificity phosphatase
MYLSPEQFAKWSRYGMEPYNWVMGGKLMASVYPKEIEYLKFLKDLEMIETVINLAESPWPNEWSYETGISCYHIPIIDMSIPTEDQVKRIIRIIDGSPGPVMIHCAAGIGRTGTLIALYLVDHGMDPSEAIKLVRQKRNGSIQTSAQESMIFDWYRIKGEANGF